jgi:hypothetical protein
MRLVEEEAQLRLRQVADLGQRLVQLGEHPEHERAEQARLVHDVAQLENGDDPEAIGGRPQEVGDLELRLAEERVGSLLLEDDERSEEDPDRRRRHPAVVGEDRLALVRREELQRRGEVLEVEQRQVVVVAVLEDEREDRRLRLVQPEDPAEEQRSEGVDGGADLGPERAREREELDRVARGLERPGHRRGPLDDLRVGAVAGVRDPRHVALDIRDEHRDTGLRQLAREQLEGLGLAGARRARDQAVAVHHRERDLDACVVEELALEHRAADDEGRFVEAVALRHLVEEGLIHGSLRRFCAGFGGLEAYHRAPSARRSAKNPHGGVGPWSPSSGVSCSRRTPWPWPSA